MKEKKMCMLSSRCIRGNSIDKKEVDIRPEEEKQSLKDQIIRILMLKEAGWTIK